MALIYIVIFVALATLIGVLAWFAHQNPDIRCCSNGCTGDCNQGRDCDCVGDTPETNANWPFPKERP